MGSFERLTHDGTLKLAPAFVAGGDEVVFSVHDIPRQVSLKRLKLSDGSQERMFPSINAHQLDIAFSADGRYQCFVMSALNPQMVLVIRDTVENKEFQSKFHPRSETGRLFALIRRREADCVRQHPGAGSQEADAIPQHQPRTCSFARRAEDRLQFESNGKLRNLRHEHRRQ